MRAPALYGTPGKFTRRLAATVIGAQGLAVFFGALVARGLASAKGADSSGTLLVAGTVLAVLCILDAGLLRLPWGITLGWALQVATFASAVVVPMMLLVAVLFGALWLTALIQGPAMDDHVKAVDAAWHAAREASGAESPSPDPSGHGTPTQEPTSSPSPSPTGQRPPASDG